MSKLNGKELGEAFGDSVNNYNFDQEAFVTAFKSQHRTIQQSMMKAMLACVEACADEDYGRDPRNEQAHKTCKQLINGWKAQVRKELQFNANAYWTNENIDSYLASDHAKPSVLPLI